jgi:hypothetical protein
MRWIDAVTAAQSTPLKMVRVTALAWMAVDRLGDASIANSLTIQQFNPYGLAHQLDIFNVPQPENLAEVSGYEKPIRVFVEQ